MADELFDYVIVGAGSAGCVLAHRLTEDPGTRVLLIEAGGWDRDPWIHIPLGWGKILQQRLHDSKRVFVSEVFTRIDPKRFLQLIEKPQELPAWMNTSKAA